MATEKLKSRDPMASKGEAMPVIDYFGEGFGGGLLTDMPSSQAVELVKGTPRVDLTKIPGIKVISEIGLDMTQRKTEKQFCSFLGLCPDNSISGGKVLHRATNTNSNFSYSASNGLEEKLNH